MRRLRLGACLSLTGRYARFGRQAANGLKAWQALDGPEVELRLEDDGSDPERLARVLPSVAAECELLLGPYSTQLMRQAGMSMADIDAVLWNHGGSGDDVQALCPGRIVSVLAPTSRYAEPFVRARASETDVATLWVVRGRGRFGRQVAEGALREAARAGLRAVEKRARRGRVRGRATAVGAVQRGHVRGRCGDRQRRAVGTAGAERAVLDRGRRARFRLDGRATRMGSTASRSGFLGGPNGRSWAPARTTSWTPTVGSPARGQTTRLSRRSAAAALAVHCGRVAGSVNPGALWAAATRLRTSTIFGAFGVHAQTGVQTRHTPVLVRWSAGQLRLA